MRSPSFRLITLLCVAAVLASGCAVSGLAFRVDDRVSITAPEQRSEVQLPVTLTWTVTDFDITGPGAEVRPDAGMFGVFVNRTPQPPGKPLAWFARNDDTCLAQETCPDAAWLAQRGIHTTTSTTFTIDALPRSSNQRTAERHEVTIVLLDGHGVRIGESAWYVEFTVDRGDRSGDRSGG